MQNKKSNNMTKGEINRIGKNLLISIQTNTLPSEQDLLGL